MRNNVANWLEHTYKVYPDKLALQDEKVSYTYKQYHDKCIGVAHKILSVNQRKIPIVVFLPKGCDVLVSFLGIAYAGDFYSPIDVDMPIPRVKKILETLQPKVVITSRDLKSEFEKFEYQIDYLLFEEIEALETDEEVMAHFNRSIDTDLLYVLFTSGSTGNPKGVGITHRSVFDYIDWVTETFNITENDSFGNQAPFYFDNSILDIYSTLKTGASLFIIPKKLFAQPVPLLNYIKEKDINTIFWVPSALIVVSKLRALKKVDLSGVLKRVLFCGEVMPTKQLNVWRSYLPNVLYANLYGPTEITDACTYYIVDREFSDEESLPIGIPMKNVDILVLDGNDNLVEEPDVVGELCVRGTGNAVGYYNNPEKTNAAFVQNPLNSSYEEKIYRTGDLVRYNERHELLYLCRKDFQIKHMGHRIELGEIETAVSSLEPIGSCCCLYDEKQEKIVLFIDKDIKKQQMCLMLSNLIPEYMLPGKVIFLDTFPLNANGKIDRVKLKEYL